MFTTTCDSCPLRVMPLFVPFNAEELAYMRRFKTGEKAVDRSTQILHEGQRSSTLTPCCRALARGRCCWKMVAGK